MDKKNKGLIEFEKLLAKEGIDINDALEKKDLFGLSDRFASFFLFEEELDQTKQCIGK